MMARSWDKDETGGHRTVTGGRGGREMALVSVLHLSHTFGVTDEFGASPGRAELVPESWYKRVRSRSSSQ